MPSTRSLISDKARCLSQSERALHGNFIIKNNIVPKYKLHHHYFHPDLAFKHLRDFLLMSGRVLHNAQKRYLLQVSGF